MLGVAEVRLLGYRDSGFDGPSPDGSLCAARFDDVTEQLLEVIAALAPQVVLVLDGSDGHRDHVRIRTAARTAVAALTLESPATAPHLYEHCLPNALMRRWLTEMQVIRPDTAYHGLDPATLGRADDEVTDVLDVRAVQRVREEAMSRHRSQRSPFDGLSQPLRDAFLGTDHLARVACAR